MHFSHFHRPKSEDLAPHLKWIVSSKDDSALPQSTSNLMQGIFQTLSNRDQKGKICLTTSFTELFQFMENKEFLQN
jgi:hypothetical protein